VTQPYRVALAGAARRGLDRLPGKAAAAIVEFISRALAGDPHRVSNPLTGDLKGYRSARRGDYRVLIRIIESDHAVLVVRIAHRADLYRPR
jgi:mRNA-degrading endonuclease RelE of RelBE toxin-antitoxin system